MAHRRINKRQGERQFPPSGLLERAKGGRRDRGGHTPFRAYRHSSTAPSAPIYLRLIWADEDASILCLSVTRTTYAELPQVGAGTVSLADSRGGTVYVNDRFYSLSPPPLEKNVKCWFDELSGVGQLR